MSEGGLSVRNLSFGWQANLNSIDSMRRMKFLPFEIAAEIALSAAVAPVNENFLRKSIDLVAAPQLQRDASCLGIAASSTF